MLHLPLTLACLCQPVAPPQDRPEVVAGEAGLALDAFLDDCAAFGFSGCVLVAKGGELLLRAGYGEARPGVPNTPETLYDIASASKQITAAAILKLEAEGKLAVEDKLADHLPDVPREHRDVELHHLLRHTAGFAREGPAGRGSELAPALATYLSAKRGSAPGKRFEYFNGGYAMLAMVVETVSGRPFEDYVAEQLFAPAGLLHTDFIETARVDEARLASNRLGTKSTTDYIKGWGYRGMGGVLTSVGDMQLWVEALFGASVLPEAQLEKMLEPGLGDYAYGWYVLDEGREGSVYQHSGAAGDFASYIRYWPDSELLVVVMTDRVEQNWQVAWGVSDLALGREFEQISAPPKRTDTPGDLAKFEGTWIGDLGPVEIRPNLAGGLRLELAGRGLAAAFGAQATMEPAESKVAKKFERRSLAILDELIEHGTTELLGEKLGGNFPASWPARFAATAWPAHTEEWGPCLSRRVADVSQAEASGYTRVLIWLEHATGRSAIELGYTAEGLVGFDTKAHPYEWRYDAALVRPDRAAGFDFTRDAPLRAAPQTLPPGRHLPRGRQAVVEASRVEVSGVAVAWGSQAKSRRLIAPLRSTASTPSLGKFRCHLGGAVRS